MTFFKSIKTVIFQKYATFTGRAPRSEYWWFSLFTALISVLGGVISATLYGDPGEPTLYDITGLLLLLPSVAVSIRRLHDVNKSGWWLLYPLAGLILIPIASLFDDTSLIDSAIVISIALMTLGYLYVLYLAIKKSDSGENQYGKSPI